MRLKYCRPWLCCLLLFIFIGGTALGNTIVTCVDPVDRTVRLSSDDGNLSLEERALACQVISLPVTLAQVRAALWLSEPLPGQTDSLVIDGISKKDEFLPRAIYTFKPDPLSRAMALPVELPLIDMLEAKPYGLEERVTIDRVDRSIVITCSAGSKPAGLILNPRSHRLPNGAKLEISWETAGDGGFFAGVSSPGAAPQTLVALAVDGKVSLELPSEEKTLATPWFVISCPKVPSSLALLDVRLTSKLGPGKRLLRGAWAWKPVFWQNQSESLLMQGKALGLSQLFVAVDIKEGAILERDKFADFVTRARAQGLGITVVEGDPAMALSSGRAIALDRLKVLNAYQTQTEVEGRIVGVQYDIEPYLLPEFARAPEHLLSAWASTIVALASTTSLDLDIVVPFWIPFLESSASLILPSLELASRITVMAYRTEGSAIQAIAEPFLAWGTSVGVPVQIALESGPLDDESKQIYEPAKAGELWLVPRDGGAIAFLLNAPQSGGSYHIYALSRNTGTPANQISFLGDSHRLDSVVPGLLKAFQSWPSFSGLTHHGLFN